MEAQKISKYERCVGYLEEPIREIVPAMWHLPYVIDTGHTCSGHILGQPLQSYSEYSKEFGWYPHRAILEFAFSEDPALTELRDQFRADLKGVFAEQRGVRIFFDNVHTYRRDKLPSYTGPSVANLNEMYNATVPEELDKTDDSVQLIESLLTSFWEQIADVVRKHNSKADIGPIAGKNFRKIINWDHWGSVFFRK